MTRDQLLSLLCESLSELQVRSGLVEPEDLGADSRPLELEEFDSLKSLEWEVLLSDRLGFEVEHVVIPKDAPETMRTLGDIADAILASVSDREGSDA